MTVETTDTIHAVRHTARGDIKSTLPLYRGEFVNLGEPVPSAFAVDKSFFSGTSQHGEIFVVQSNMASDIRDVRSVAQGTGVTPGGAALLEGLRKDGLLVGDQLVPDFDQRWEGIRIRHEVGHFMTMDALNDGTVRGELYVNLTDFEGPYPYSEMAYLLLSAINPNNQLKAAGGRLNDQSPIDEFTYPVFIAHTLAKVAVSLGHPLFAGFIDRIASFDATAYPDLAHALMQLSPAEYHRVIQYTETVVIPGISIEGTWDFTIGNHLARLEGLRRYFNAAVQRNDFQRDLARIAA